MHLIGATQEERAKYAAMTECDLSEKGLTELTLAAIKPGAKTTVLDVNDNRLEKLPAEIGTLEALEELLVYKNQLKELPTEVGALKNLKTLNAFNNALKKLPPTVGQLKSLVELNVGANKLMMVPDDCFASLGKLEILSLQSNNLVRLGSLAPIAASIKELRLFENNLDAPPSFGAAGAPKLELFEMNKNRLAAFPDDYFANMPMLNRFVVSNQTEKHGGLTALPASLASCTALQFLLADANKLEQVPAGTWPALETLFLDGNPLKTLPAELKQCKSLKCARPPAAAPPLALRPPRRSAPRRAQASQPGGGGRRRPGGGAEGVDDGEERRHVLVRRRAEDRVDDEVISRHARPVERRARTAPVDDGSQFSNTVVRSARRLPNTSTTTN